MSNVLLGMISYCPSDLDFQTVRYTAHQKQLRWLEGLDLRGYTLYRVEQGYTAAFTEAVKTSLPIQSLPFDTGIGPAAARNQLLKQLYNSDADWLVCLDDDRSAYSHYGSSLFFRELAISPHWVKYAKLGTLITGVCPARAPFKKANAVFSRCATHWNLCRGVLDGCLQLCCIPNLVKYGGAPIYFDETLKFAEGEMPEDIKFEIDWILSKHFIALNRMLVVYDHLPETAGKSTVYADLEARRQVEDLQAVAVDAYIRTLTHNRITDLKQLNRQRNMFTPVAVPRVLPYQIVPTDYGKYEKYAHF